MDSEGSSPSTDLDVIAPPSWNTDTLARLRGSPLPATLEKTSSQEQEVVHVFEDATRMDERVDSAKGVVSKKYSTTAHTDPVTGAEVKMTVLEIQEEGTPVAVQRPPSMSSITKTKTLPPQQQVDRDTTPKRTSTRRSTFKWGIGLPFLSFSLPVEASMLSLARAIAVAERQDGHDFEIVLLGPRTGAVEKMWSFPRGCVTGLIGGFCTTTSTKERRSDVDQHSVKNNNQRNKGNESPPTRPTTTTRHLFWCAEKSCSIGSGVSARLAFAFDFLANERKVDLIANFDSDLLLQPDLFPWMTRLYRATAGTRTLYSGFKSWFFGPPFGPNLIFDPKTYTQVVRHGMRKSCRAKQEPRCTQWDSFVLEALLSSTHTSPDKEVASPKKAAGVRRKGQMKATQEGTSEVQLLSSSQSTKEVQELETRKINGWKNAGIGIKARKHAPATPVVANQERINRAHQARLATSVLQRSRVPQKRRLVEAASLARLPRSVAAMNSIPVFGLCKPSESSDVLHLRTRTNKDAVLHLNNENAVHFGLDPFNAAILDILSSSEQADPEQHGSSSRARASQIFHWAEDMWAYDPQKGKDLDDWTEHLQSVAKMRRLAKPIPISYVDVETNK
ncbi:unnamed protein product [Amoebophrya sp. A25]|nr:unnamed protein product [Amoebophrya sp. A25]|eukprot:GSA25T00026773001.1